MIAHIAAAVAGAMQQKGQAVKQEHESPLTGVKRAVEASCEERTPKNPRSSPPQPLCTQLNLFIKECAEEIKLTAELNIERNGKQATAFKVLPSNATFSTFNLFSDLNKLEDSHMGKAAPLNLLKTQSKVRTYTSRL